MKKPIKHNVFNSKIIFIIIILILLQYKKCLFTQKINNIEFIFTFFMPTAHNSRSHTSYPNNIFIYKQFLMFNNT